MLTKLARAFLDRMLGWYIQEKVMHIRGQVPSMYGDPSRVKVASTAIVNNTLFNVISGTITIGDYAFFGHDVALLTGTHDYSLTGLERQRLAPGQGHDIVIEMGAWIGSRAIVIGPCRIGRDAVVAAGAIVTRDVPEAVLVAGVPATVLKSIRSTSVYGSTVAVPIQPNSE